MTKQDILEQALALAPEEREELAEELLLSLPAASDAATDAAWADEAERRLDRHEQGQTRAAPVEEVLRRLEQKYRR